ncbi:MAG: hypothetical protein K9N35_02190 [Candidatus Marinimicrobia bacterium]|nr:hypothetical protein [Candidatus Neomarinimicrobiota bacterium]
MSQSIDSTVVRSPKKALLYSIIPGGGQLYNHRPLKALFFAGVFTYFSYEYVNADELYQNNQLDETLHRDRNDQIWLMALTWVLNVADAYVEAQLWDFDEYDVNASSLPENDIVKPKETEK